MGSSCCAACEQGTDLKTNQTRNRQNNQIKATEDHPVQNGIIVAHHGICVEVLFDHGSRSMVRVKRNSGHVVGDHVAVKDQLLERFSRKTELRRRDARNGIHLVAANLDVLGFVLAQQTTGGFIDRANIAARAAGLLPFIIVNKCDLEESLEMGKTIDTIYKGSVQIFKVSTITAAGLDQLKLFFSHGHRGAFVGSTGVGKSSLLNAICPEINLQVGEISDYKWMGRHTTTVSTLHTLPDGGELVDTPGFRDFGLVDITVEQLSRFFPGFEQCSPINCRFSNCKHRSEPGCSILELLNCGSILPERYETYLELLTEVESEEERKKCRAWKK